MRGSRVTLKRLLGDREREDPVAQPHRGKGHEGSAQAMVALASFGLTLCRVR